MYLARKVSRSKWSVRSGLSHGEVPADGVTTDLRTKENALSVWDCGGASEGEIEQVVLALATAGERIDKVEVAWVLESDFNHRNLTILPTDGRTPLASFVSKHRDIASLDLKRLGVVAKLVYKSILANQWKQFTKKQVKEIIMQGIQSGAIKVESLPEKIRTEMLSKETSR